MSLLLLASVAALLVTRQVYTTADLGAAMGDSSVNDIEMAAGVYHLADEPGLGCTAPDTGDPYMLCIGRDLTIRAAVEATRVVLDGGQKGGVVFAGLPSPVYAVTLQGLEITNGMVYGTPRTVGTGAGIRNWATLSLDSVSVYGNFAAFAGGGINNEYNLTATNLKVHSNRASDGGGIKNHCSIMTLTNSEVYNNTDGPEQGMWGGGISSNGPLTIVGSSIHHNIARSGGGIHFDGDTVNTLTIIDTVVHHNIANVRPAPSSSPAHFRDQPPPRPPSSTVWQGSGGAPGHGVGGGLEVMCAGECLQANNMTVCFNVQYPGTPDCSGCTAPLPPCPPPPAAPAAPATGSPSGHLRARGWPPAA